MVAFYPSRDLEHGTTDHPVPSFLPGKQMIGSRGSFRKKKKKLKKTPFIWEEPGRDGPCVVTRVVPHVEENSTLYKKAR